MPETWLKPTLKPRTVAGAVSGFSWLAVAWKLVNCSASSKRCPGYAHPDGSSALSLLYALAGVNEAWHFVSRKPVLISLAAVRLMAHERGRQHYDSTKAQLELGVRFRPVRETLRDTVDWYRQNGWDPRMEVKSSRTRVEIANGQ